MSVAKTVLTEPSLLAQNLLYKNWSLTGKYQKYTRNMSNPELGVRIHTEDLAKFGNRMDILVRPIGGSSRVEGGILNSVGYVYDERYDLMVEITVNTKRGSSDAISEAKEERWLLYSEVRRILNDRTLDREWLADIVLANKPVPMDDPENGKFQFLQVASCVRGR